MGEQNVPSEVGVADVFDVRSGRRVRCHDASQHLLLRRCQSDHLDALDCVAVET